MTVAVTLSADNPTAERLRVLWDRASAFEDEPSEAAKGYAPHITLVHGEFESEDCLALIRGDTFKGQGPITLTFQRIRTFDGDPLVLWAEPRERDILVPLQAQVHTRVPPESVHPHYRPATWIPHCTLASGIKAADRSAARAFANEGLEPFEVLFDALDCVTFPPVEILARRNLVPASGI